MIHSNDLRRVKAPMEMPNPDSSSGGNLTPTKPFSKNDFSAPPPQIYELLKYFSINSFFTYIFKI